MSKRNEQLYIQDILTSIARIQEYTAEMNFEKFANDYKTIDAVIRNFSVIGEAAKNLSEEFKMKNYEIPWNEIIGMRNKIIHEYFGIDEEILWQTIKKDLLELEKYMNKFYK